MNAVAVRPAAEFDWDPTRGLMDALVAIVGIWAVVTIVKVVVAALAQVVGIALLGYLLLARP